MPGVQATAAGCVTGDPGSPSAARPNLWDEETTAEGLLAGFLRRGEIERSAPGHRESFAQGCPSKRGAKRKDRASPASQG